MAQTTARKTLRNRADRLFSKIIRSVGVCEAAVWDDGVSCGGGLQCAHIIGRANYRLRWDLLNALSLCAGHHVHYTNHPMEWYDQIATRYPERYTYLKEEGRKMWDKDYLAVLGDLEAEMIERGL